MKIGFIGAGNMGGALAKAVSKSMPSCSLYISDRNDDKIKALLKDISFTVSDNEEIAEECDLIFFGVKPGAITPSDTSRLMRSAVVSSQTSLSAIQSPNEHMRSVPLALANAIASGESFTPSISSTKQAF